MNAPPRRWLHDGRPRLGLALLALAGVSIGMLLFEGAHPAATSGVAPFPHFDKLLHFMAHVWVAGLMFWGGVLSARPRPLSRRTWIWAASVLAFDALSGLLVELVQSWLGSHYGRQFDWKDLSANLAGTCFILGASVITCLIASRRAA